MERVHQTLHLKLRDLCETGARKIVKVRSGGWPQGNRHERADEFWDCGSTQTAFPVLKGESGCKVPPLAKKLFSWYLLGKGNPFTPMHSHCVYQPHSKVGPIPRNSWPTKNMNSTGFSFWGGVTFVLSAFCLGIFLSFLFWFLIWGFFVFVFVLVFAFAKKRERGTESGE